MAQQLIIMPTTASAVAERIVALANHCIACKQSFHIVLAGGETPRAIYALLRNAITDWHHWHIYFGDERCYPVGHPQRNDTMAFNEWLAQVPVPHEQIHSIPAELPPAVCVEQYTQALSKVGTFDLVLLGLGEDGHTASLFPGNDWGEKNGAADVMVVDNAPKAPELRITLSARRLSNANHVWFLVKGENKHAILQRWQSGEILPASAIQSKNTVIIFKLVEEM